MFTQKRRYTNMCDAAYNLGDIINILSIYLLILFYQCMNILVIFNSDIKNNPNFYDTRNKALCVPISNFLSETLFEL